MAAFTLAFLFWEAAARLFILKMPAQQTSPGGGTFTVGDAVWSYDGFSRTRFSKEGFRTPYSLPAKGKSVLVIGDSFTAAQQVSDSQTFASVAQQVLAQQGITATFYNKGIAGGAPPRYIAYKSDYYYKIKPDHVIVQLDERDFTADFPGNRGEFLTPWNGEDFDLEKNPRYDKRISILKKLPASDQLLSLSMVSVARRIAPVLLGLRQGRSFRGALKGELPERTKEYVDWTIEELKQAYPNLIIAYIPQVDYFNPEASAPRLESYLSEACRSESVPFINTRADYLNLLNSKGIVSHGFSNTIPGEGHINAFGHRILGQALAKKLTEGPKL